MCAVGNIQIFLLYIEIMSGANVEGKYIINIKKLNFIIAYDGSRVGVSIIMYFNKYSGTHS